MTTARFRQQEIPETNSRGDMYRAGDTDGPDDPHSPDGSDRPDRGSVTVEAALVLAVLVVVVASCLAGIGCMVAQLRCADAAREAARLAGRGDTAAAAAAVAAIGPSGAVLSLDTGDDLVTATVSVGAVSGLLPGVTIRASASAANETAPGNG